MDCPSVEINGELTVLVMAVPDRGVIGQRCRESIEESDIGRNYVWHVHPEGLTPQQHFRVVMERAKKATTRLVLFLEDDAIVNRHIAHNVTTWADVSDPRFGAGWLLNPGGSVRESGANIIDYIYGRRADGTGRWVRRPFLNNSVGLLFRTEDLPEILRHAYAWQDANNKVFSHTDLAVSQGVWRAGKHLCIHTPSLVEHQIGPSMLGHKHHPKHDTSNGTFVQEWKR